MATVVPPRKVFEKEPQPVIDRLHEGGYCLTGFQKVTLSFEGGMLSHSEGHPVPRKGLQYPDAVLKTNIIKRLTLSMFSSFAGLKSGLTAFLQEYLNNYCRLADSVYDTCERVPYLKKEYYCTTSKGVWDLAEVFLKEIGIKEKTARHFGKILATILENDDAYRLPLVDVMSEFTKEEIVRSPRKFIKKFLYILTERNKNEVNYLSNAEFIKRFTQLYTLLRFALYLPRFRRAFKKAFQEVDLYLLQYDEYDRYWSLPREGYNYQGIDSNTRMRKFKAMRERYRQEKEQNIKDIKKYDKTGNASAVAENIVISNSRSVSAPPIK